MRLLLFALTVVLVSTASHAADNAAKIGAMLTKPKSWTLHIETTDAATPSDRFTTKQTWQFFEQDKKLMARTVVAFGGCATEVSLRDDGFSFRWCPPLQGEPSFTYDPNDPKYPFKSYGSLKRWLSANE